MPLSPGLSDYFLGFSRLSWADAAHTIARVSISFGTQPSALSLPQGQALLSHFYLKGRGNAGAPTWEAASFFVGVTLEFAFADSNAVLVVPPDFANTVRVGFDGVEMPETTTSPSASDKIYRTSLTVPRTLMATATLSQLYIRKV